MLHDFDCQRWPDPPDHPLKGAEILRQRGYPEEVISATESHADYLPDCPCVHLVDKALYACGELRVVGLEDSTRASKTRPTPVSENGIRSRCCRLRPLGHVSNAPVHAETGRERVALGVRAARLTFSPDGQTLATGSDGPGVVQLWDVGTGKEKGILKRHKGFVAGLAFRSDGKALASIAATGEVKLWDLSASKETATLDAHKSGGCVAFRHDGKTLVSSGEDGTARLWDAVTGKAQDSFAYESKGRHETALSCDGKFLALAYENGEVRLWDVATRTVTAILRGHTTRILCLAFRPDGKRLATTDREGTIKLWDLRLLPADLNRP